MFYEGITQSQVISTRALLKMLRFLRVTGHLEVSVEPERSPMNQFVYGEWRYTMRAIGYHPNVYKLPIELQEEALSKFLTRDISLDELIKYM